MMSDALCNARSPLLMRQEFLMFKVEKIILFLRVMPNRATTEEGIDVACNEQHLGGSKMQRRSKNNLEENLE